MSLFSVKGYLDSRKNQARERGFLWEGSSKRVHIIAWFNTLATEESPFLGGILSLLSVAL